MPADAPHALGLSPGASEEPHVVKPPASRARRIGIGLSVVAVLFSLGCGYSARTAFALRSGAPEPLLRWLTAFLVLLLVALLFRMGAAICELLWLERTWSNLPARLRKVGPMDDVSSGMALAISFVPGIAWIWKLGLVVGIAKGFEGIRSRVPFTAPIPRTLGMAAVIVGWVPILNVYLAPFLWEVFAARIDVCVEEILRLGAGATSASRS